MPTSRAEPDNESAQVDLFAEALRWDEYDSGLREINRHVPPNAAYFDTVFQGCLACERELPGGTTLYRGRILPHEKETDTDPLPFCEMGMPPADVSRDQRLSPSGIPVFYAALDLDTVVAELRPWPQARLSIATFITAGPVKVLDLSQINPRVLRTPHLSYVAYMISRPVHLDDPMRYLGTQYLAQRLKAAGARGLLYDSQLKPNGTNIALFSDDGLKPFSRVLRIVTKAKYESTSCVSVALNTARLELNTTDDTGEPFRAALQADPLVDKYIGRINPDGSDVAHMFTIFEHSNRIGIVALVKSPAAESDKDIGLLCGIEQNARREGRATEACQAVIKWAGTTKRWTRLLACVDQSNEDSEKLVAKLGFQFQRHRKALHGSTEDVFSLDLPT